MGKIGWIWFLVFVILPVIQKVMEAKKQQTQNQIKKQSNERKKARRKKRREQEVEDPGWIQAGRAPVAPVAPANIEQVELGGGWVAVGDTVVAPPSTATKPASPLPAGIPQSEGDTVPLEVLSEQLTRWGLDAEIVEEVEDVYLIVRDAHDEKHEHKPAGAIGDEIIKSALSRPAAQHGANSLAGRQSRWRLTRSQLRNRLIWSEILGPPVTLKPPDSR